MPIAVKCESCGKSFRAADKLGGKRVKCPKCGGILTIPASSPPEGGSSEYALADGEDASSRPSEVAGSSAAEASTGAAAGAASQEKCPSCAQPLAPNAVLCVACGYNVRTGEKLAVSRVPASASDADEEEPEPESTSSEPGEGARSYLLGCVLSLVGTLIGAVIWYGLAMATEREFPWVALGLGALTGMGMAIGSREHNDLSGFTAGFIAIVGIIAARWLIFAHVVLPIIQEMQEAAPGALPSTTKLFFTVMLDAVAGVFMLMAFFMAYLMGSGKGWD